MYYCEQFRTRSNVMMTKKKIKKINYIHDYNKKIDCRISQI